jgi:carbon-monoxide dehydrogenase small subunit
VGDDTRPAGGADRADIPVDGRSRPEIPTENGTMEPLTLRVNGTTRSVFVAPHRTLLETLREDLGLTGTKHGCELGECGACTVLIDGAPVLSCLVITVAVDGADITTIEGVGTATHPDRLQRAFAEYGAAQCGYCTPAMVLTAKALLDRNPNPEREEIAEAIAGNMCRCTGYLPIVRAIAAVAGSGP